MFNSKKANIVISIVIAIVVWAYVVGAVDPVTTKGVSDVKLTIRGTEELLVRGLAIKKPETKTIELNIKGKRSRVQNIDPSRIKATVNVSECSAGDNELSVSYSLPSGLSVVDASTSDVHIEATETVTKRKNVKVKFTNEESREEVGNVLVSPSVINVSGSKSQINKVAYIKATTSASRFNRQGEIVSVTPVAVDQNGKEVPYVVLMDRVVTIEGKILAKKTVNLHLDTLGTEKNGFEITLPANRKITIVGEKETLDKISKLEGTVDVSGLTESRKVKVTIPELATYGIGLSRENNPVYVQVSVSQKANE